MPRRPTTRREVMRRYWRDVRAIAKSRKVLTPRARALYREALRRAKVTRREVTRERLLRLQAAVKRIRVIIFGLRDPLEIPPIDVADALLLMIAQKRNAAGQPVRPIKKILWSFDEPESTGVSEVEIRAKAVEWLAFVEEFTQRAIEDIEQDIEIPRLSRYIRITNIPGVGATTSEHPQGTLNVSLDFDVEKFLEHAVELRGE